MDLLIVDYIIQWSSRQQSSVRSRLLCWLRGWVRSVQCKRLSIMSCFWFVLAVFFAFVSSPHWRSIFQAWRQCFDLVAIGRPGPLQRWVSQFEIGCQPILGDEVAVGRLSISSKEQWSSCAVQIHCFFHGSFEPMPGQPEDGLMFAEDRLLRIRSAEVFFSRPFRVKLLYLCLWFSKAFWSCSQWSAHWQDSSYVWSLEWYQVVPWTVHQDLRYGQCPGGSAISSQTVEALAAKVPIGSLPSNSLLGIFQFFFWCLLTKRWYNIYTVDTILYMYNRFTF